MTVVVVVAGISHSRRLYRCTHAAAAGGETYTAYCRVVWVFVFGSKAAGGVGLGSMQ